MSKWIIIPDVHGRRFWRDAVQGNEGEKIIFLGDYVDPYDWEDILPGEAYKELQDIIAFKKEHPDNVVLLLGNHDLGYLDPAICTCRRDTYRAEMIRREFEANLELFDIVHIDDVNGGRLLFSHAGIAESWIKRHIKLVSKMKGFRPERLNEMLHGDLTERERLFHALADVSWYRGGLDKVGSPVWADVEEYLNGERLLGGYQHIFGHTLHEGGLINVRDHGYCLDCAQAFVLDLGESPTPLPGQV